MFLLAFSPHEPARHTKDEGVCAHQHRLVMIKYEIYDREKEKKRRKVYSSNRQVRIASVSRGRGSTREVISQGTLIEVIELQLGTGLLL